MLAQRSAGAALTFDAHADLRSVLTWRSRRLGLGAIVHASPVCGSSSMVYAKD